MQLTAITMQCLWARRAKDQKPLTLQLSTTCIMVYLIMKVIVQRILRTTLRRIRCQARPAICLRSQPNLGIQHQQTAVTALSAKLYCQSPEPFPQEANRQCWSLQWNFRMIYLLTSHSRPLQQRWTVGAISQKRTWSCHNRLQLLSLWPKLGLRTKPIPVTQLQLHRITFFMRIIYTFQKG